MSAEFVDTNVLVYAHDLSAGSKRTGAAELLARLVVSDCAAVSTQVLSEFFEVLVRKRKMPAENARAVLRSFGFWQIHRPTHADLLQAAELQEGHQLAWWDALILNSAQQLGCETLWSEDFTHGRRFGRLTVRNPFR